MASADDSYNNKKYFLTIRDAATRYYSVCFLEKRSEAADKLIEWIQEAEAHFLNKGNFKVKNVRTDNGGEFTVQKLHDYFKSRGIVHQLTVPTTAFKMDLWNVPIAPLKKRHAVYLSADESHHLCGPRLFLPQYTC